jgi:tetratricopeptide (TPR) repeat protein
MKAIICLLIASCVSAEALLPAVAETAGDAFSSGLKAFQKSDYHQAIGKFDEAIQRVPNYVVAYEARATAQIELMRWEKGLSDPERAISLGSTQSSIFALQANALYDLGRYDQTVAASSKAIHLKNEAAQTDRIRSKAPPVQKK